MPNVEHVNNYIELRLLEWGREICVPNKAIVYSKKKYHLFHYVVSGKGHFEIGGKKYELHRGMIFYIPPETDAKYAPDYEDPWVYEWLGFDGAYVEKYLKAAGISIFNPIYNDNKKEIRRFFSEINNEANAVGYLNIVCLGLAYELFGNLTREYEKSDNPYSTKAMHIQKAKEFILNNYQFEIRITDIASNVGVSPNYLANVFAELENSSPKKFLIDTRMQKAALLLKTGEYKIKTVGQIVGYKNQLHFSNEFKKYYGVSPLAYKDLPEEINK